MVVLLPKKRHCSQKNGMWPPWVHTADPSWHPSSWHSSAPPPPFPPLANRPPLSVVVRFSLPSLRIVFQFFPPEEALGMQQQRVGVLGQEKQSREVRLGRQRV